ncbi:hypothetical protein C0993_010143 [Termitomyces sp. T159_Od127]|nr:hypothetical protein C0993_010143 [Termitomyces sp. T159_Od127]
MTVKENSSRTCINDEALRFEGSQAEAEADEPGDAGTSEREGGGKTFTLEDVGRRLKVRLTVPSIEISPSNPPSVLHTPSTPTVVSTPSPPPARLLPLPVSPEPKLDDGARVRAYEELAGAYDAAEGMHAKAEVLAGMSDEEVVLLVQKNKVTAYAL